MKSKINSSGASKRKKILLYLATFILVAAVSLGIWQYLELRSENQQLTERLNATSADFEALKNELVTDPNTAVSKIQQEQNSSILDEIAKVYAIPANETPTIATVQDVSKLTDQSFFENAQNGDVLVVFSNSSQAVLYRPDTKQLVKVGPISTGNSNTSGNSAETESTE